MTSRFDFPNVTLVRSKFVCFLPEAEAGDSDETANVIPDELDELEGRKELLDEMVNTI